MHMTEIQPSNDCIIILTKHKERITTIAPHFLGVTPNSLSKRRLRQNVAGPCRLPRYQKFTGFGSQSGPALPVKQFRRAEINIIPRDVGERGSGDQSTKKGAQRILDSIGHYALTKDEKWGALQNKVEHHQRESLVSAHPGGTLEIHKLIMARRIGISRTQERAAATHNPNAKS